jgi:hypothetical protein|tara:strand:+ start:924 stop:1178 length:255 start_codon:yes stop_codon:yes gene_type:complete
MGMIKRIHVNQHNLKWNRTHTDKRPPISVITYKGTTQGDGVQILGMSDIIHKPENPLSCGAHVWMETNAAVKVILDNGEVMVIE